MRSFIVLLVVLALVRITGPPMMAAEAPTDEQIAVVYREEPVAIYEMVRKLWYIEQTPAVIVVPDLVVSFNKDDTATVEFKSQLKVTVGESPYVLDFQVKIEPKLVKVGRRVIWPTWVLPVAGVALFGVGFGLGILAGIAAR